MGFLSGGVTGVRYEVKGLFETDPERIAERLRAFNCDRSRVASADGVEVGWAGGRHHLDGELSCEKNLRGEFWAFDFRVTTDRLPADKLRAYYAIEVAALAAQNPSGVPTARQKREAREAARERLEEEAKDGRYKKHKVIPVVWDTKAGQVWFGSSSLTHTDRFEALFRQSFGGDLDRLLPGRLAGVGAEESHKPAVWVPGVTPEDFAWVPGDRPDWLGNEFLLWLAWRSEVSPTGEVGGIAVMVARTLTLECPRGQGGHETVSHLGPLRLPEVKRALQAGKLPRRAGLTAVLNQEQYEFTLAPELWAVTGGKVPKADEEVTDPAQRDVQRLEAVRGLWEVIDALYGQFAAVRLSPEWAEEVTGVRKWLGV